MKSFHARAIALIAMMVATHAIAQAPTTEALPVALVTPAVTVAEPAYLFRMPLDDRVVFQGAPHTDDAGLPAYSMLYAAPGLAGAAAALIAHGLIVNAQKNAQKERLQAAADEILLPYTEVIERMRYREMLSSSLLRMTSPGTKAVTGAGESAVASWVIDSEPVFRISQDHRALILDNLVTIQGAGKADQPAYRNVFRVVSAPVAAQKGSDDAVAWWTADSGARLKEESVALMAESFDVALILSNDGYKGPGTPRTVRYPEGGKERMERGEVLDERCGRVLVRTLRGWIMSIPAKTPAVASPSAPCSGWSAAAPS